MNSEGDGSIEASITAKAKLNSRVTVSAGCQYKIGSDRNSVNAALQVNLKY